MENKTGIPRIIHYCWFGGNHLPPLAVKCINSWKSFNPGYEIKEWNESNFDIDCNNYVKQAYAAKMYAFVSDYARFHILYNNGGIYMDTDVEVLRPLDIFLANKMFTGFERTDKVAPGLILGSEIKTNLMKVFMDGYKVRMFIDKTGNMDLTTVVDYTTEFLQRRGLLLNGIKQEVEGIIIYPTDYFCPKSYETGECITTRNTYTIHHFAGSWKSSADHFKIRLAHLIGRSWMKKLSYIKRLLWRRKNDKNTDDIYPNI